MKFRNMREVYWLEASASVTSVIENVTPTTVIIEPAIVDNISRAPCGASAKHARPADHPLLASCQSPLRSKSHRKHYACRNDHCGQEPKACPQVAPYEFKFTHDGFETGGVLALPSGLGSTSLVGLVPVSVSA